MRKNINIIFAAIIISATLELFSASRRQSDVIGGPRGIHPYLFKGVSGKNLVETARNHKWAIEYVKSKPDTLHIIAIRVEFKKDTSELTTGNGLFGIRGGGDLEEKKHYVSDTVYKYDALPHDSLYFALQLEGVKNYFKKVSRGKLTIEYTIYPSGGGEIGYMVDSTMPYYSPGGKKRKESWDEYYERKTRGLITFVRDAIKAADAAKDKSPFAGLTYRSSDKTIRDSLGRKTVFLIFHAGSSYLTDGGEQGYMGQDTPSDMIDAFVTPEFFKYYRDTLKLDGNGVKVNGRDGSFLIDEVMMCSETSNQDGLNWGIQGILVNQVARQLGIPDLFSTSSGISGIGAFCIMDFSGYSAGKGFIPPYPSAWVRAFMGWDKVYVAPLNETHTFSVKALTSVLDRKESGDVSAELPDTTIILIPLNDHEYYLIENRQRNLSGDRKLFNYDTLKELGTDSVVIRNYPYIAGIDECIAASSGKNRSNVVQRVHNNDVGLPASGLLVWHIDEQIIRNRLDYNAVNADSLYRGIRLVEADGITDLGIMFYDFFYQAAFDYGGAEDVFPHRTVIVGRDSVIDVRGFGPFTKPSTRANDGGHTYLKLDFAPSNEKCATEKTVLNKQDGYHLITNYSDSVFYISVSWDNLAPTWPRRAAPAKFYDLLIADIDIQENGNELFLLDTSGRVYLWPAGISSVKQYNKIPVVFHRVGIRNDTLYNADTAFFFDSALGACDMPTAIRNTVFVPSRNGIIYYFCQSDNGSFQKNTIVLNYVPSTYLCNYRDSAWAVGCSNGRVVFGIMYDTAGSAALPSSKPVCALAALRENGSMVAAIQTDGTLSLVDEKGRVVSTTKLPQNAIGPFTLITADLDRSQNETSEIVVSDSRHGLWVYGSDLKLAPGWIEEPPDWPSYYRYDTTSDRNRFPANFSAPAVADIDRDGYLDIITGGSNGLYAFNYKGALKSGWPALLDKRLTHWYQRGGVAFSPAIVSDAGGRTLVIFSSSTGENQTYYFTKVIKADRRKGIIWFERPGGVLDSISDLTTAQIDTILTIGDSIIAPYTIPGGFVDAVGPDAKRPNIAGAYPQSYWPLTTGSSVVTAPLIGHMNSNDNTDLIAVTSNGWVYRWKMAKNISADTLSWPQTGFDAGRSFAFGGKTTSAKVQTKEPITFFSFPNPVRGDDLVTFKYKFNAPATDVRLDIYSYTGFKIYSTSIMGTPPRNLSGSYPDWNILTLSIKKDLKDVGPGVYRCRLEAAIDGKKHHCTWKMAVIR